MTDEEWLNGIRALTEEEWLRGVSIGDPINYALKKGWNRKLRLLACACVRRFWSLLPDGSAQFAVLTAERWADHQVSKDDLERAFWNAYHHDKTNFTNGEVQEAFRLAVWCAASRLSEAVRQSCFPGPPLGDHTLGISTNVEYQTQFLNDIFGNPFRTITLNSSWLTSTVLALSNSIYNERAFDRMPILADALQDAGCDNEDILNHCRQPGEHVRGCWVVDLLLGKS